MTDSDFATGTVLSQNGFCVEIGIGRRQGTQGEGKLRAMITVALDGSQLDGLEMAVKRLVPLIIKNLDEMDPRPLPAEIAHQPQQQALHDDVAVAPAGAEPSPAETHEDGEQVHRIHDEIAASLVHAEPEETPVAAAEPIIEPDELPISKIAATEEPQPVAVTQYAESQLIETRLVDAPIAARFDGIDLSSAAAPFVEAVSAHRISELSQWAERQNVPMESVARPAPAGGLGGVFARLRGAPEQPYQEPQFVSVIGEHSIVEPSEPSPVAQTAFDAAPPALQPVVHAVSEAPAEIRVPDLVVTDSLVTDFVAAEAVLPEAPVASDALAASDAFLDAKAHGDAAPAEPAAAGPAPLPVETVQAAEPPPVVAAASLQEGIAGLHAEPDLKHEDRQELDHRHKPDSVIAEALSALAEASRAYEATLSSSIRSSAQAPFEAIERALAVGQTALRPVPSPAFEPQPVVKPPVDLSIVAAAPAMEAKPRPLAALYHATAASQPAQPAAPSRAADPMDTLVLTELAPPVGAPVAEVASAAVEAHRPQHPAGASIYAAQRWEQPQPAHDFEQPFVLGRLNMADEAMAVHDAANTAHQATLTPEPKAKPRRGVFNVLFGRLAAMMFL